MVAVTTVAVAAVSLAETIAVAVSGLSYYFSSAAVTTVTASAHARTTVAVTTAAPAAN